MEFRLGFDGLSYDGIGDFIANAVERSKAVPLYLLGKAAAYVDIAAVLGRVFRCEALRTTIAVYAGVKETAHG